MEDAKRREGERAAREELQRTLHVGMPYHDFVRIVQNNPGVFKRDVNGSASIRSEDYEGFTAHLITVYIRDERIVDWTTRGFYIPR